MSHGNTSCTPNPSPNPADEFVRGADVWPGNAATADASRRAFLKRMAAALAFAGVGGWSAGCSDRSTDEKLVARVAGDGGSTPGIATSYATAMPLSGYGRGVLVTSREGRPIKIEGNPDHPSSLGGTDVFGQASILDLYDPSRLATPTFAGAPTTWSAFFAALEQRLSGLRGGNGSRLRILSGTVTSPTLIAQIHAIERAVPGSQWHSFDPLARDHAYAGATIAFGRPLDAIYSFDRAKVVLSLDADFLFDMPGSLRHARHFADGRRVRSNRLDMNRLYVVEPAFSLTGSMADHRLMTKPSEIADVAQSIAQACGVPIAGTERLPANRRWVDAVVDDLKAHRCQCLVIAGESQPPIVHALACAMNDALGNVGSTVTFVEPIPFGVGDERRSLATLVTDMNADAVDTLIIVGDDPSYAAPSDVDFARALERRSTARNADGSLTAFTAHLTQRANATSFRCQWALPQTHYLEQWSDVRGHDGTATIIQPLIAPLYGGRSVHEIAARLAGHSDLSDYEIVRSHWKGVFGEAAFDQRWSVALQRGVIDGSAASPANVGRLTANLTSSQPTPDDTSLQIAFRPDHSAWDGTFTANAWLQELPRPFSKLVWDNAAFVSEATAKRLALAEGDLVRLAVGGRAIDVPIALLPGTADDVILLHLGYGQSSGIAISPDIIGSNAYAIRRSESPGFVAGVSIEKLGRRQALVKTRSHHAMDSDPDSSRAPNAVAASDAPIDSLFNRRLVRIATIDALRSNAAVIKELGGEREKRPLLSLYPASNVAVGYQWGMSIDQTACMGCNACVVACQAENNIPVVGKEQVERQREMHWLRIDDYLSGDAANPRVTHQAVPCMHCENAPCEVVCPVAATTHSVEGLNQMTYNRCVGTRYCSNNCPYKVRRFNFLDYTRVVRESPQRQLQQNPEVTVRVRGVMEKCTYCVQRLQRTRIDVERVTLNLREKARSLSDDGAKSALLAEAKNREFDMLDRLETACAQACPTRAIQFGSITPVAGRPTRLMAAKKEPTDYTLLAELTTKPRTSYLARITNPNPALAADRGEA